MLGGEIHRMVEYPMHVVSMTYLDGAAEISARVPSSSTLTFTVQLIVPFTVTFCVTLYRNGWGDCARLPETILVPQSSKLSTTDASTVVAPKVQAGADESRDSTRAMISVPPVMGPDDG